MQWVINLLSMDFLACFADGVREMAIFSAQRHILEVTNLFVIASISYKLIVINDCDSLKTLTIA